MVKSFSFNSCLLGQAKGVRRKITLVTLSITLVFAAAVMGYQTASPKVEFKNLSGLTIDEFKLQLPSSQVTIGPLASGKHERIYFSFQLESGEAHYEIWSAGKQLKFGVINYEAEGQLFRKIAIVYLPDGSVDIQTSG